MQADLRVNGPTSKGPYDLGIEDGFRDHGYTWTQAYSRAIDSTSYTEGLYWKGYAEGVRTYQSWGARLEE